MRFSLLPKDKSFYQLLEKLAIKAEETVRIFNRLIHEWNLQSVAIVQIRDFEHACDLIVHEIMVKLNKTFVTPIDREDIHLLAKTIDDLVDSVYALSERMSLFKMTKVKEDLKEMGSVLEMAVHEMVEALKRISRLEDKQAIFERCIQIHTLENLGDRLFATALGNLFDKPEDPIEVIKWKEIFDFLEEAIDQCEDIADIIWGIAVKYG